MVRLLDIPISQLRYRWQLIACLTTATLLAGCSAQNGEERHWTEDVLLEDSTTVQIERHVVFDESDALGGGTYNAVESKSTLKFKGELASLPAWDFPWTALVLYRTKAKAAGHWVIVGTTSSCERWGKSGQPNPPYWQYELINGQWTSTPLSQESIGKTTNLFYRYWKNDVPKHVTPAAREIQQSDPRIAEEYRRILSNGKSGCMPVIWPDKPQEQKKGD